MEAASSSETYSYVAIARKKRATAAECLVLSTTKSHALRPSSFEYACGNTHMTDSEELTLMLRTDAFVNDKIPL